MHLRPSEDMKDQRQAIERGGVGVGREGKWEKFLQREMKNLDTQECGSMNNLVFGCQVSHTAANSILVRALLSFEFFLSRFIFFNITSLFSKPCQS